MKKISLVFLSLTKSQPLSPFSGDDDVLEIKRQLFHLILGLFISFGVYLLRPMFGSFFTALPLILALVIILLIPRVFPDIRIANHLLYHFERNDNIIKFPFKGAFWYGLGIIFPILLLPLEIACAIIIVISVGDSVSTLVGRPYGRHKFGEKSIEGFLAFVISSFIGASIFVEPEIAIVFALIGGLMELFITFVDDNFLIPVSLTFLYLIFGGFF